MRLDAGTKGWTCVVYGWIITCICMIGIVTDIYRYVTVVAGYLHIEAFAMSSATIAGGQSTVTLSYTGAWGSIRNIHNESYLIRNRPYLCVYVRICEYQVRMAFSNVLLRITSQ